MSDSSFNFWQKARAKIQGMATSPQAERVKKLAQNAAQELQHQTGELLQNERVQHLRRDASQTAQKVTQQAGTVLGHVTETIKTTTTDLVAQAKKQLDSPPNPRDKKNKNNPNP